MKEYDYAHQMNRPVPLTQHGKPTGALILHRAIKKASNNAPTRKNAPRR
ncbi:hypothetical protein CPT_Ponderosa_009 [Stenotrophomonas phage Ponderosa]|uniref:Uncharacterized protein n=2 Tax=Ponderosavirus TaxID=3424921 RepID=A0A5B9NAV9_9CAUD|nr:hypothetical protein CPT_Ponderosa_009 [Stenotrophomonas phage Ponderosa]